MIDKDNNPEMNISETLDFVTITVAFQHIDR